MPLKSRRMFVDSLTGVIWRVIHKLDNGMVVLRADNWRKVQDQKSFAIQRDGNDDMSWAAFRSTEAEALSDAQEASPSMKLS